MENLYPKFSFSITHQDGGSRVGIIKCPHGEIETPAFIFCGTKASVKGVFPQQLHECGTQIILSNTYHLMLQPTADIIQANGGLHKFMGWNKPILTDSGGFQIFSLGHGSVADEIKGRRSNARPSSLVSITEHGATFKSYIDGSVQHLTPEKSIEVQRKLGVDFMVSLDECTPYHSDYEYTKQSMLRSHRWEQRSLNDFIKHSNETQSIYGIVQGGVYKELRNQSVEFVNSQPFFANAVGGTLGGTKEQMYEIVGLTMENLNKNRPTHLLGIGGLGDILENVSHGIDTFDCVHPTRIARHGAALTVPSQVRNGQREHINLKNSIYKIDDTPIQIGCRCHACLNFSKGYLHHLLKANELLAFQAISVHNIAFMNNFMTMVRSAIKTNTLEKFKNDWKNGNI